MHEVQKTVHADEKHETVVLFSRDMPGNIASGCQHAQRYSGIHLTLVDVIFNQPLKNPQSLFLTVFQPALNDRTRHQSIYILQVM